MSLSRLLYCLCTDLSAGFSDDERAGKFAITDESDEDVSNDGELDLLATMLTDGGKARRKTADVSSKSRAIKKETAADKQDKAFECTSENDVQKEREDQVAWMKGKGRAIISVIYASSHRRVCDSTLEGARGGHVPKYIE